jgi:hypothetical protein
VTAATAATTTMVKKDAVSTSIKLRDRTRAR